MSVLNEDIKTLNNSAEKEGIIKFLYQYAYGNKLYIDDYKSVDSSDSEMLTFAKMDHSVSASGSSCVDLQTYEFINKKVSKYYLKLIDNQWVIIPTNIDLPIPVLNYYGDMFPDYIRFANCTSIYYINTQGKSGNFGY